MKVAIISRHSVANYGSLWQAYSLQTIINNMGYEAININYTPEGEVGGKLAKTIVNISRWGKNPITKLLFLMYQYPSFSFSFYEFKKFREKYLIQTQEYVSSVQINLPDVDIFCTGSDQVWNGLYDGKLDDAYFLSFLPDNKKRIAYAASFGGSSFQGKNIDKYHKLLKKYNKITVRESTGVKILDEMGISSQQVLDPTLLLSIKDWMNMIPERRSREKYLLIYQLRPNKSFDKYAKELAKRKKLKLIRISPMLFQIFKVGSFKYLPKAEDFLWYINNAECLLTDSFHGTCFAINFKTQFIEILPGKFNDRNLSLLKELALENRVLKEYDDFTLIDNKIDFDSVHEKLLLKRKESVIVLKSMLEGD